MKSVLALGLGLLSVAHALPSARAAASATVDGTRFSIDGKTGYFAGTNSYWIGFLPNTRDVDTVLDHLATSGLKILRVWGFNDVNSKPGSGTAWFQLLSSSGSQINTGADGLQRLDYLVQAAEKCGIKLIINFVNYWDDFGGMNAYVRVFGGNREGWYTNARAQEQYKKYIQAVVSRYSKSNAIFAWELANEPRCNGCNTDVIYKWATDTSAYIRSLDANHMITLGDEGFGLPGDSSYPYQYGEGTDFVKNLGIKNLDFGTFHMYPDGCTLTEPPSVPSSLTLDLTCVAQQGASQPASATAGSRTTPKPARLPASPASSKNVSLTPSSIFPLRFRKQHQQVLTTKNPDGSNSRCDIQKPWQQTSLSLAANGMGGDLFWQWGDQLSTGQTHNDGNTVYFGSSLATCLVTDHVNAINAAN